MNDMSTNTIFLPEESSPYSKSLSPVVGYLFYLNCVLEDYRLTKR